ncbi:MAG: arsenate reductase ArsC [Rhodospirillaceae bacterium]|jgi:protein-tyrosine-phosphatase|nr:arsenate reductase ArsC [Rhodospirillaceae bacterium]MBT4937833.1 arsenate reductase ArsC [Rhodospirillaceae bacterium]MBT5941523.1 arsenate reductase ArsC [Rhodospirillaceae bacterium]MBT7265263.1 arsenate reductase ArsC [Rhodospirillaceae bacterium]
MADAINLPSSVLFACTMNSIRSVMAEGILKKLHGDRIYVDSVGVRAGEQDGFMVEVMAEIDIDLSNHQSKTFATLEDTSFDMIISLSPEAQHSAVELTRWMSCEVVYWPTFDPDAIRGRREARLDGFRQIRDDIYQKIAAKFPPI